MYLRIMDEVIEACRVPFEEDGINNETLEDLKKVRLFLRGLSIWCRRILWDNSSDIEPALSIEDHSFSYLVLCYFACNRYFDLVYCRRCCCFSSFWACAVTGRIFPIFGWGGNLGILGGPRHFTHFLYRIPFPLSPALGSAPIHFPPPCRMQE